MLADGRHDVDDASLVAVRRGFEAEFLNGIDGREILETERLRVIVEQHPVDLLDGLELGIAAAVRRVQEAFDHRAFAQEAFLDRVGRDKNVRRLRRKEMVGRAQEAEALLGDFQIAGAKLGRAVAWSAVVLWRITLRRAGLRGGALWGVAHKCCAVEGPMNPETILNCELLENRALRKPFAPRPDLQRA